MFDRAHRQLEDFKQIKLNVHVAHRLAVVSIYKHVGACQRPCSQRGSDYIEALKVPTTKKVLIKTHVPAIFPLACTVSFL